MIGIGSRLREERERLKLTQRAFGDIGGVEPNAQGKYENGDRAPKADYLAAVAARGVDVLYVLTGRREPVAADQQDPSESQLLTAYRLMPAQAREGLVLLTTAIADPDVRDVHMQERLTQANAGQAKPSPAKPRNRELSTSPTHKPKQQGG